MLGHVMKERVTATKTMIVQDYWCVAATIVSLSLATLKVSGAVMMTAAPDWVLLRDPV